MTRFSPLCAYPPSTVARYRTIPDDCDLRNHMKRDMEGGRGSDLTWTDQEINEYCRTHKDSAHVACVRTTSCDPSLPSPWGKGMKQPGLMSFGAGEVKRAAVGAVKVPRSSRKIVSMAKEEVSARSITGFPDATKNTLPAPFPNEGES